MCEQFRGVVHVGVVEADVGGMRSCCSRLEGGLRASGWPAPPQHAFQTAAVLRSHQPNPAPPPPIMQVRGFTFKQGIPNLSPNAYDFR